MNLTVMEAARVASAGYYERIMNCKTVLEWENLADEAKGAECGSFINVDGKNVTLEAVKKCEDEDAYIVRFVEKAGRRTKVTAEFFAEIASVTECNLLEREDVAADIANGKTMSFEINPFEIKCYKVKVK